MNRRDFLQTTTAGLAAAVPALVRGEDSSRIKVGFLGVAYSHAAEKIRILRHSPDFELVGVWPETTTLGEAYAAQGVRLLQREQILGQSQVVVVESGIASHASLAREALEAGCHVHLEKPPALTLTEFDDLIRLARTRRRLLQIGYMWRHNPGLNAAFEAARQGWLGSVFLVRATINNTLDAARRREWAELKGGVLFELGSHMVDAVVRLLGRPTNVTSFLKTHGSTSDSLSDNNVAVLEYPAATAVITSATLQPNASAHRAFEILGTRGTAVVRPLEPPILLLDLTVARGNYGQGPQTISQPEYRRYEGEFAELARAIRQGNPLSVSLETERDIQETLLRACQIL